MFYIAQIIGIIICIVLAISYFLDKKSNYIFFQLIVNILYGIQYLLLGAFSAAINNAASIIKYIVFGVNAKKCKKNPKWQLIFFGLLGVIMCLPAVNELYTWIPIISTVLYTYAIWQDNPIVLRIIVILLNILWIIYNTIVKAYFVILCASVEIIVAFVTIIRTIKKRDKKSKEC